VGVLVTVGILIFSMMGAIDPTSLGREYRYIYDSAGVPVGSGIDVEYRPVEDLDGTPSWDLTKDPVFDGVFYITVEDIPDTSLYALYVDGSKVADSLSIGTKVIQSSVGTSAIQDEAITPSKVDPDSEYVFTPPVSGRAIKITTTTSGEGIRLEGSSGSPIVIAGTTSSNTGISITGMDEGIGVTADLGIDAVTTGGAAADAAGRFRSSVGTAQAVRASNSNNSATARSIYTFYTGGNAGGTALEAEATTGGRASEFRTAGGAALWLESGGGQNDSLIVWNGIGCNYILMDAIYSGNGFLYQNETTYAHTGPMISLKSTRGATGDMVYFEANDADLLVLKNTTTSVADRALKVEDGSVDFTAADEFKVPVAKVATATGNGAVAVVDDTLWVYSSGGWKYVVLN
jgi:hypothetical protein